MGLIFYIFCGISFWYFANIIWLIFGFTKVKFFESEKVQPKSKFSIIVPFRNEAENLPKLLQSISQLNYPMDFFEVILVDDESNFRFQISETRFDVSIINNYRISNSPKKDAINTAISIAKYDWIITTDADCFVPENWLATFDAFIQKNNPKMIAAGVSCQNKNGFLDAFQTLDFLSLQGSTIGSFGNNQAFMCNGANFCYQKSFFYELNGFHGNDKIATGDDVFLLQKAIQVSRKNVHFLKSFQAIVKTNTEKSWQQLFNQRVRWASKTANYNNFYSKQLAVSVLLMNCVFLLLFASFFYAPDGFHAMLFLLKIIIDFTLLSQSAFFFKIKLTYFRLSVFVYPIFCVCVAIYSLFGNYTWKNRRF